MEVCCFFWLWVCLQCPAPPYEKSADTHHDHTPRGQDKSQTGPQPALESVPPGVALTLIHFSTPTNPY